MKKKPPVDPIDGAIFARFREKVFAKVAAAPKVVRDDLAPYKRLLGRWRFETFGTVDVRQVFNSDDGKAVVSVRIDGTVQTLPAALLDAAVAGARYLGPGKGR
jgi:hypothetical protein